jgi:hypothetical protein
MGQDRVTGTGRTILKYFLNPGKAGYQDGPGQGYQDRMGRDRATGTGRERVTGTGRTILKYFLNPGKAGYPVLVDSKCIVCP